MQDPFADFYEARRCERFPLAVNDIVRLREGDRSGAVAVMVSLEEDGAEPKYLVEFPDGNTDLQPLSNLELVTRRD